MDITTEDANRAAQELTQLVYGFMLLTKDEWTAREQNTTTLAYGMAATAIRDYARPIFMLSSEAAGIDFNDRQAAYRVIDAKVWS